LYSEEYRSKVMEDRKRKWDEIESFREKYKMHLPSLQNNSPLLPIPSVTIPKNPGFIFYIYFYFMLNYRYTFVSGTIKCFLYVA
jgi:hypothetical protein